MSTVVQFPRDTTSQQRLNHIDHTDHVTTTALPDWLWMTPEHIQRANEYTFARKYIDRYIRYEIQDDQGISRQIGAAVGKIQNWLKGSFYPSKEERLDALREYNEEQLIELIYKLLVGCAYCQSPELFTSITAQLAYRLGWDDHKAAITTIAELMVPLAEVDLIDILFVDSGGEGAQYNKQSVAIQANFELSDKLLDYVRQSMYLPPLLCEPQTVKRNNQSGYLTFNDSVVLNARTDAYLALDVINTQNKIPLTINLEFVLNVPEVPNKPLDTIEKQEAFEKLTHDTNELMLLLHHQSQGNTDRPGALYLTHKFDQRGRMYSQGYHINYQSTPWRKAVLEFHDVEYVDVPEQYQTSL